MIKLHVNTHIIKRNLKHGENEPPVAARVYPRQRKTAARVEYGYEVRWTGESRMIYDPEYPLECGARLWVETEAPIEMRGDNGWRTVSVE